MFFRTLDHSNSATVQTSLINQMFSVLVSVLVTALSQVNIMMHFQTECIMFLSFILDWSERLMVHSARFNKGHSG